MGGWGSPWPKRDPKAQRVILQVLFLFLFLGMFFVFYFSYCRWWLQSGRGVCFAARLHPSRCQTNPSSNCQKAAYNTIPPALLHSCWHDWVPNWK